MNKYDIKKELFNKREEEYRKFSSSLLPKVNNILGVKLPILRKMAKEIYKSDWRAFLKCKSEYMEETMLKGMVIGLASTDKEIFNYIESFVPLIDNWSVCDSFCASLKFSDEQKSKLWKFLMKYYNAKSEYEIRFSLVMMLNNFIQEKYISKIFDCLNEFKSDKYYAQMACAWLISECYMKYKSKTSEFLKTNKIDNYTFNKAIQKIMESNRISKEEKLEIKKLKR